MLWNMNNGVSIGGMTLKLTKMDILFMSVLIFLFIVMVLGDRTGNIAVKRFSRIGLGITGIMIGGSWLKKRKKYKELSILAMICGVLMIISGLMQ